jgi:hypothetical protein
MSLPDIAVVTVPDEKQTVAARSIAGPSGAVAVLNGDSENLIGIAYGRHRGDSTRSPARIERREAPDVFD